MKLENIKGIGPKTINILYRLGINTTYDLLTYYPFRYNVLEKSDIRLLNDGDKIVTDGIVEIIPVVTYLKNHRDKMQFKINTGSELIIVIIFNRGFFKNKLHVGSRVTIIGKYDKRKNIIVASEIRFSSLKNHSKIEPVYHVSTGINSIQLNNLINSINKKVIDYIPDYLNEKYNFVDKEKSLSEIHNPTDFFKLEKVINKLKYEELFLFMAKMNYLKSKKTSSGLKRTVSKEMIEAFIDTIPFKLTGDQIKAIDDIYKDLVSSKRMNRLLQGDVGSGKTIVAFTSLYINYLSGYQGALMAPTEILANQHFINIKKVLPNLNIALLTGKLKIKEKQDIYKRLQAGELDIVIGTHALISENVTFNNLGLVITDEQHRFGVNQRSSLKNKGITPDILYMSATPIPRTYAITLFGDMDISSIKTKPSGRKDIISYLKSEKQIKEVLTLMYSELKKGHQVYVVAPLIEDNEKSDLENVLKLKDKMQLAFGKLYNIDIMHGKLKSKEKEVVIDQFKQNKIQILITTTVIEVGIDVPNATVLVVFDSYMFGLSALHQLRGRVGRSNLQSYFVMISNSEAERLKILTKTNDGFEISEADFKLRGSGELFGIKQSGDMTFKLADVKKDFKMLIMAKEDSLLFLNDYIDSPKYIDIKNSIQLLDLLD